MRIAICCCGFPLNGSHDHNTCGEPQELVTLDEFLKKESELAEIREHLIRAATQLSSGPVAKDGRLVDYLDWITSRYGEMLDQLLNHCPIGECSECAKIVCPHGDPFHLHHDGCPACAESPETEGIDHP